MMKCLWTPNITVVEKRTSLSQLEKDKHKPLSERCITHDGPEYFSSYELLPVSQSTAYKLSCDAICAHFSTLGVHLSNACIYFK